MIEQGVDIYTVKEFLGHRSLEKTQRYVKVYLKSLNTKYDAYRTAQEPAGEVRQMTEQTQRTVPAGDAQTDHVVAAYRRRLDEMKRQLAAKEAQLHQKQRELDRLYGKLAAGSRLTQAELSQALVDDLHRVTLLEEQLVLRATASSKEN